MLVSLRTFSLPEIRFVKDETGQRLFPLHPKAPITRGAFSGNDTFSL